MKWLRILATTLLVALGSVSWLIAFNLPLLMFSQLGFCESVEEMIKPDRHCPAPLWYWIGSASVPLLLAIAGYLAIRRIWKRYP